MKAMKCCLAVGLAALAANLFAETHEVTTVAELQTAIANANDGTQGDIHLAAGIYDLPSTELIVTAGVRIYGDDWKTTIIRQVNKDGKSLYDASRTNKRVITLNHADAKLENVTITGGRITSTWNDGLGGGVKIGFNGGKVSHCMISNNVIYSAAHACGAGVGMQGGTLEHSYVIANTVNGTQETLLGGGLGFISDTDSTNTAIVDTCLIANNNAPYGGGVGQRFNQPTKFGGITIRNSTIANNSATVGKGGGVYLYQTPKLTFKNCILAKNTCVTSGTYSPNIDARVSIDDLIKGFSYCLIGNDGDQKTIGGTNKLGSPAFESADAGDYHLTKPSEARALGCFEEGMLTTDLDGVKRPGENSDAGCYQFVQKETFTVSGAIDRESVFMDQEVRFTATPDNPPAGDLTYTWTLKSDRAGIEDITFTGSNVAYVVDVPGSWTISVKASGGSPVETAEGKVDRTLKVGVHKIYVTSQPNEKSAFPYDTEATAATNLNEVLTGVIGGAVIDLDEGEHVTTAEPLIDKGVTLVGRGIDKTFIKSGALSPGYKTVYSRVLHLDHSDAVVSNLTLSGQVTKGGWEHGSVLYIGEAGGTAARCRIVEGAFNVGNGYGAGAALDSVDARLIDCEIDHCTNLQSKAAALYCTKGLVRGCFIHDCYSAGQSQSSVAATMGDIVSMHGDVTLESCTIVGNRTIGSTVGSVAVFANSLPLCVVNNIVACNEAPNNETADSASSGAPNWATNGDLSKRTLYNCWFGSTQIWGASGTTADPEFKNAAVGNYRLASGSPCIGVGQVYDWMATAQDLDGNPRLRKGKVDLGCYQSASTGMILFVR